MASHDEHDANFHHKRDGIKTGRRELELTEAFILMQLIKPSALPNIVSERSDEPKLRVFDLQLKLCYFQVI